MSNSYLSEDVLVHVLRRLPLKSLGRCKTVSKSWNDLISSSKFIRFHLEYQSSIQNKLYRLLTKDVDYQPGVVYIPTLYQNKSLATSHETHLAEYSINVQDMELGCEIQRLYNPYESHASGMTPMLVGSCNGLLSHILSHDRIYREYEISLCNPLTKTSRVLPRSPLFLKGDHPRRIAFYGFGYDDVHDTYKVFLASKYEYARPGHLSNAKYEYEVYSLRTNKWMKVSSDRLDLHDYEVHSGSLDGVLISSALHWNWILRNDDQNKKKNHILSFDLRADKLDILPLPDAVDGYYNVLLPVLNGCLLLSDHSISISFDPETIVDMWLMKDYGLKDSWTRIRIRNSPHHLGSEIPVALVEDNHHKKKLIYHDIRRWNSREIVNFLSYDIESHQVEEFPAPQPAILFHRNPKQLQFVGSLVQPHPPSSG